MTDTIAMGMDCPHECHLGFPADHPAGPCCAYPGAVYPRSYLQEQHPAEELPDLPVAVTWPPEDLGQGLPAS